MFRSISVPVRIIIQVSWTVSCVSSDLPLNLSNDINAVIQVDIILLINSECFVFPDEYDVGESQKLPSCL